MTVSVLIKQLAPELTVPDEFNCHHCGRFDVIADGDEWNFTFTGDDLDEKVSNIQAALESKILLYLAGFVLVVHIDVNQFPERSKIRRIIGELQRGDENVRW